MAEHSPRKLTQIGVGVTACAVVVGGLTWLSGASAASGDGACAANPTAVTGLPTAHTGDPVPQTSPPVHHSPAPDVGVPSGVRTTQAASGQTASGGPQQALTGLSAPGPASRLTN